MVPIIMLNLFIFNWLLWTSIYMDKSKYKRIDSLLAYFMKIEWARKQWNYSDLIWIDTESNKGNYHLHLQGCTKWDRVYFVLHGKMTIQIQKFLISFWLLYLVDCVLYWAPTWLRQLTLILLIIYNWTSYNCLIYLAA